MDCAEIIMIDAGKRGGRPCIRGMRITVGDVLGWLAAGMRHEEILSDYPELTARHSRNQIKAIRSVDGPSPVHPFDKLRTGLRHLHRM